MSNLTFYFIILLHFNTAFAANFNLNKDGLALEGHDAVSYFSPQAKRTGPIKGDQKFEAKINGVTYHFHSLENKNLFLSNPSKYTPAFGGWCAYAIAETKEKVTVDVRSFLIQDGRLLLFYNGFLADTRKKWQNNKSKTAASYLKQADSNWTEIKSVK